MIFLNNVHGMRHLNKSHFEQLKFELFKSEWKIPIALIFLSDFELYLHEMRCAKGI